MSKKRKTWQENLADNKGFPKACRIDTTKSKCRGAGMFVIPAPLEVDARMRYVHKGKFTTIEELRKFLARRHHATIARPITTGISAWISANAANEAEAEGKKRFTPYWCTLKTGGELNPKYPGGVSGLKRKLQSNPERKAVLRGKFCGTDGES
jgi:hypothetical protein